MFNFRPKQRDINITKEQLSEFEKTVSDLFEAGKIHGPVHLSHNNEDYLIDIFQYINPFDWVFSNWRNHYHALLHGIPKEELMSKILDGKSISFQSPEHNFYTSAIVNGNVPIAVGTALALKWDKSDRRVWCFVGDMTSESGTFYEAVKYSIRNDLPIHFIVEDNGLSTNSPTQECWGTENAIGFCYQFNTINANNIFSKFITYRKYTREVYPHVGIGKWIHFVLASIMLLPTLHQINF